MLSVNCGKTSYAQTLSQYYHPNGVPLTGSSCTITSCLPSFSLFSLPLYSGMYKREGKSYLQTL